MKQFFLWILLGLFVLEAHAQQTVSGFVTDSEKNPVEGANVVLTSTGKGAPTDSKGFFSIKTDDDGTVTLRISYVGFKTEQIEVTPGSGDLTITLTPAPELEGLVIEAIRASDNIPVTQTTISRAEIDAAHIGQDAVFSLEKLSPSILAHSESGTQIC